MTDKLALAQNEQIAASSAPETPAPEQKDLVVKNFTYMRTKLDKTIDDIAAAADLSTSTLSRLIKGKYSERTIEALVDLYNKNLYPHNITVDIFTTKDLSQLYRPRWDSKQILGTYICPYLSPRGTGTTKALLLNIVEKDHEPEAWAIDIIHDINSAQTLSQKIFSDKTSIDDAKKAYKQAKKAEPNDLLMRDSRFLSGTVDGCGNILSISLNCEDYNITITTSLKLYLDSVEEFRTTRQWCGGAAIASFHSSSDWPYSMLFGMVHNEFWNPDYWQHPTLLNIKGADSVGGVLREMNKRQINENMLGLTTEIDTLWYEAFMEAHRNSLQKKS